MGNCISCTDPSSSQDQPEYKLTHRNNQANNQECESVGVTGAMSSIRHSDPFNSGGGSSGSGIDSGSRTPAGSSSAVTRVISMDGSGPNSQKTEKKTFYSRIPPLGRTGSTDKKSSSLANNVTTIKDNNNAYSESKIAALFDHYKDASEELILAEGIEKLCKELEVKPEDFKMLVLAWKFSAEQMCRFTRDEFFGGMKELKTDTVEGIQARLPDLVQEVMNDPTQFKELYRFSFKFALDCDLGQRILPTDMAVSLWRVVFSQNEPPILDRWVEFLESQQGHVRGVPRDTWNMFLNFVETVGTDLSAYDDTEAWPSLFDDFVEYENDKLNQNTISATGFNHHQSEKMDQHQLQQVIQNSISMSRSDPYPPSSSSTTLLPSDLVVTQVNLLHSPSHPSTRVSSNSATSNNGGGDSVPRLAKSNGNTDTEIH